MATLDLLVRVGKLDTDHSPAVALVVESKCNYERPIAFPTIVACGLRVGRLGRSSIRYEFGVFADSDTDVAAHGYFVHVFVDRQNWRPTDIPADIRAAVTPLLSSHVAAT